jgi:hypothetical protein
LAFLVSCVVPLGTIQILRTLWLGFFSQLICSLFFIILYFISIFIHYYIYIFLVFTNQTLLLTPPKQSVSLGFPTV